MQQVKNFIKDIFPLLGIKKNLINSFGLAKTLTLYSLPSLLKETGPFINSLPKNCVQFLKKVDLKPGDTVIDIGANIGDVSNYFASKGCTVNSYEPNPSCVDFLKMRFKKIPNVTIFEGAVSNYDGHATFFVTTNSSLSSSLINRNKEYQTTEVQTKVFNITSILMSSASKIKLIKIDIEGAEYDLLEELIKPELSSTFDYCAVEVHYNKMPELKTKHDNILQRISENKLSEKFFLEWH
jgi:FkbM family methyltransferase